MLPESMSLLSHSISAVPAESKMWDGREYQVIVDSWVVKTSYNREHCKAGHPVRRKQQGGWIEEEVQLTLRALGLCTTGRERFCPIVVHFVRLPPAGISSDCRALSICACDLGTPEVHIGRRNCPWSGNGSFQRRDYLLSAQLVIGHHSATVPHHHHHSVLDTTHGQWSVVESPIVCMTKHNCTLENSLPTANLGHAATTTEQRSH